MNEFIEKIYPLVEVENAKRGYPLYNSVVIAQAILETGWGNSEIMLKANAIFGIKADVNWRGKVYSAVTKEVYNKVPTQIVGYFRAYDNIRDSISDYFNLITKSPYYRKACVTESPRECITEIKNGGYATDPLYIDKVMTIIEENDLYKFDLKRENIIYEKGKDYTLQEDLHVRVGAGTNYRIKEFDELTEDGKKHAYNQRLAVLKKGTVVTVLSVYIGNDEIWLKIPSGYIAGKYKGEIYVK